MTLPQLQEAILDLVGPPNWRDLGITDATLQLQAKQLPRLTLQCAVLPRNSSGGEVQHVTRRYELREINGEPPLRAPVDLDAMARAALERVKARINQSGQVVASTFHRRAVALCAELDFHMEVHRVTVANLLIRENNRLITTLLFSRAQPSRAPCARPGTIFCYPLAAALLVAFVLGWFGPSLDAEPDRRHEAAQADQQLRAELMVERWEADARHRCAEQGGDNTGWIATANGSIVCTDKRGRRLVARKEVR
jgi:hypothetical protein